MASQTLRFSLIIAFFLLLTSASAQFARVEFDYANAYFNNGQPLPAAKQMIVTGQVSGQIDLVEMDIFRAKAKQSKPSLFRGVWKRKGAQGDVTFRIPVNLKLTGSSDYDVRFVYYRGLSDSEALALRTELYRALDNYLAQSFDTSGNRIRLRERPVDMISNMDAIVVEGLTYYRNVNEITFQGFSDLLAKGISNLRKQSSDLLPTGLAQLQAITRTEVDQILHAEWVIREDVRQVSQYETQRTRRPLALNVGFGGVLLDRGESNFSYDTSPYVGLSLPLANPALSGRFWSNASVSLGVFLQNFENADSATVTGPIFGRPYYLGLGYNFFRFIRLNVGVTALEEVGTSSVGGGNAALDVGSITLQPFVGVSAELDLWVGFRERR